MSVKPLMTLDPVHTAELKRSGNRAYAARQYETARRHFIALIAASPTDGTGYVGLAKANAVLGLHADTVARLEPVAAALQHWGVLRALADATRILALRGNQEHLQSAIAYSHAALALRPEPVLWYYLGQLLERSHDFLGAATAYGSSLALDPTSHTVQAALARTKQLAV